MSKVVKKILIMGFVKLPVLQIQQIAHNRITSQAFYKVFLSLLKIESENIKKKIF